MPSRKEIQWSQLKVGVLVLVAICVLIMAIVLMSSTSGGLFSHRLVLRTYFPNASGLKNGAPVTLEGVTIGNVSKIRVVPERNPMPVEVTLKVGSTYAGWLHTDSSASIAQAGVLGDSYVDIDSTHAKGPVPPENGELPAASSPTISDVIRGSSDSLGQLQALIGKLNTLVDTLNSTRGPAGKLINDPQMGQKFGLMINDLQAITSAISSGKGSLGKLVNDDTLYSRANNAIGRLENVTNGLDEGKGTMGKLLKDDSLYNNLNSTVANANELLTTINSGKGAMGKFAKDPAFAQKLDDTVTRLNSILKSIDEGEGTAGQLVKNRSLYDHTDQTMDQAQQLVKAIRENPKKYFVIHLKLF